MSVKYIEDKTGVKHPLVADTLETSATIDNKEHVGTIALNDKGNFEISNAESQAGDKVNIVSKGAIQLKPGLTKKNNSAAIALDNEFNTASPCRVEIQATNGNSKYKDATMGIKLQTAEVVIDNKGAFHKASPSDEEESYDIEDIHMKYYTDRWNGGRRGKDDDNKPIGPTQLKIKARSIDLRCHDHGGIALQPAGKDGEGKENKIKFESDRTSSIDVPGVYNGEGGKGLEFGTFNNLHTSLYTGDYRFNEHGVIYPSTRGEIYTDEVTGKTDYPPQEDDFKDIIASTYEDRKVTWGDLITFIGALKHHLMTETDIEKALKYAAGDFLQYINPTRTSSEGANETDNNEQ